MKLQHNYLNGSHGKYELLEVEGKKYMCTYLGFKENFDSYAVYFLVNGKTVSVLMSATEFIDLVNTSCGKHYNTDQTDKIEESAEKLIATDTAEFVNDWELYLDKGEY